MEYARLFPTDEFLFEYIEKHGPIWRVQSVSPDNYVSLKSIDGKGEKIAVAHNHVKLVYNYSDIEKSPLGVKPRKIFVEQRISVLANTIDNYVKKGYIPNIEWGEELLDRINELNEIKEVS